MVLVNSQKLHIPLGDRALAWQCLLKLSKGKVKHVSKLSFVPAGALSRAVCWYLTCDRYWEAGTMEPPEFPWGLVTGLVLLLTLGISLAYYIVWVLCE